MSTSFLATRIGRPQALSYYANQVKRLSPQHRGITIELAQVSVGEQTIFIAGINSAGRWTKEQRALLNSWNVTVIEPQLRGQMTRDDGGALHAEENMAAYIQSIGGRGVRWSRAVVGACFDTKSGSRSYVCHRCRAIVATVGGEIEPPF
jgi:hypothetical protein